MNNYYTWGDSGVSWVSETLQSDSGGYMASSQFNSSGKEYCYLVLGYDADWIKQKTAPSRSRAPCFLRITLRFVPCRPKGGFDTRGARRVFWHAHVAPKNDSKSFRVCGCEKL
jgi:hypothetical protein